jgi:ClpP class serine protease
VERLSNLIWLWIVVTMTIIPMIRQWMVTVARQALIKRLETKRGSRVILLIHRAQPGLFGLLFARFINMDDSEQVLKAVRQTPAEKPIDLVLHTAGGLVIASEQIARALREHRGKVTVFVPQYALSGGTFIALAADGIVLDQHAILGPVDPQINGLPASSYMRAVREKSRDAIADQTWMLTDVAEKAVVQVEKMLFDLLQHKMPEGEARRVARTLTEGRWTHDYPLHVEELREMGIDLSTEMPAEVLALLDLSGAVKGQQALARAKQADKK